MKKVLMFLFINLTVFSVPVVKLMDNNQIEKFDKNAKIVTYDVNNLDISHNVVDVKKERFINMMVPSIIAVRKEILKERDYLISLSNKKSLTSEEQTYVDKMLLKYKIKDNKISTLIKVMKPVPVDLAIAQAILESGWGTSRFFRKGNAAFGVWSFSKNDKRMASTHGSRNGKKVYLKSYDNIYESCKDYFRVLATGRTYKSLRKKLQKTEDYRELTKTLINYSEIRGKYVTRLNRIIRKNNLTKYNKY